MKKIILLLSLFLISLITFSCSRDNEDSVDNTWIYGKWNVTQYSESQNGTYNDMAILGWYAQFNSDGSYKSYSDSN